VLHTSDGNSRAATVSRSLKFEFVISLATFVYRVQARRRCLLRERTIALRDDNT